ncbi:intermembrane transport protein PqiB [Roseivivax isoporae]|uniref:Mce/MlaD domain-containing protein n=1 Tax=Roseivivax isoporae LMG 25204 TaxID=1449351 RepID=X7F794_9RHOB|nr:MlaD family protein [Roseivivax isoporae]ETX28563.1 hypothetical protein RISW2_05585 [Roseivivax isoporae LMG 25204]
MNDDTPTTGPATPGEVPIESRRRSLWDKVSIVWLIPVVALGAALSVAWRNYADQGPLIEIAFDNAAGISADETELRYRDIAVGVVEDVGFNDALDSVIVSVRLDRDIAEYVDTEARFWVVRPEVSARGVSGLDTVLSGVYIQGAWDSSVGDARRSFTGLERAPLVLTDNEGVTFTLTSPDGLPTSKTPIIYKGVEVGMVDAAQIDATGAGVIADAVIYSNYADLVSTSTRFWDISGFSFSLGASGAQLNFTSFASLISGGVTFETLGSGGEPLRYGATYELFPDEEAARDNYLVEGEGEAVDVSMIFDQNLSGLSTGAAVELGGLRVGEVASLTGIVDEERFGDSEVRLLVTARINPGRFGLPEGADAEALFDYLERRIDEEGLRARLTNASILTGGLKIQLTEIDDASEAALDRAAEPYPSLPTAPAEITDVTATAQGALQRVSDLPIEEVMQSAIDLMNQATTLIGSEALQESPDALLGILTAFRGVAESDAVQGLPDQVSGLVGQLQETSETLDTVIARIEERDTVGTLTDAVSTVNDAASALPDLLAEAQGVLANAREVPLQSLSAEVSNLLTTAQALLAETDRLLASEDVQAVPGEVRGLLSSTRDVVESEGVQALPNRVSGLVTELQTATQTLSGFLTELEQQDAVGRIVAAIEDVQAAADDLPALVEEARGVVENANEVPLDQLATDASELITSADRLLDQESTRALPSEINTALAELRATLAELREGGIVENANATLASARSAADAIAEASQSLPQLSSQLRALALQAEGTLAGFDEDAVFTRDTRAAIRQVQEAAEAIERLARTIERNPNSLILGR